MMLISLALACLPGSNPSIAQPTLEGQYLEVRTCDVYTGPCVANGEVNEIGKEATVAWKVDRGAFQGVDLSGTSVVAVLRNRHTFGDPYKPAEPVETAIFTDEGANPAQQTALLAFAKQQLGTLSVENPRTASAPIELATGCCDEKGCATLRVGDSIAIDTRCVKACDKLCGHEDLFYPPLTGGTEVIAAVAEQHKVDSDLFGVRFTDRESRGAMTGKFQLATADLATLPRAIGLASPADDAKQGGDDPKKADPTAVKKVEVKIGDQDDLPAEVPAEIAKLLDKKGLKFEVDSKPYCELWLRTEVPIAERAKASLAIKFSQIEVGEIVGALKIHGAGGDYKNNTIKAGLYVLRYGVQPEDGDHMGTAPNRDFFLLTSVKDDTDVAPIADMEKLGELSIKAGEDHPLTMQVRPLEGDAPKQPTVIHDAEHHLWIADLALTGRVKDAKETKSIRCGLVVVGMSEDA